MDEEPSTSDEHETTSDDHGGDDDDAASDAYGADASDEGTTDDDASGARDEDGDADESTDTTDSDEGAGGGDVETSAPAEGETPTSAPSDRGAKRRRERRPTPKPHRVPLTFEQRVEARERTKERLLAQAHREPQQAKAALDIVSDGKSIVFAGRFRRVETGGMDERGLAALRERWEEALGEEERRIELREMLRSHGALDEKTEHRLERAATIPAMEDVAAAHLPVVAGRATVARGLGLEGLARAIREAAPGTVLSDLAKPFVKEGQEPASLDAAIAGARDILAEEMCLGADVRARLRKTFRKEAVLETSLRSERKGDPGPHKTLVGYRAPIAQVQPLKFLALRRAEKERVVTTSIEPTETSVLEILQQSACADDHPHAGFLRAAIEDGYRRILKPLFQAEIRVELKQRADLAALETFERNLRHRLLGPVGGRRAVLGLRPDVTNGHRWCALDADGLPSGSGTLPHEGTAGREPCLAELCDVIKTYEVTAIAVGSGGGRSEALSLAEEAARGRDPAIDVTVVPDGGTHVLESQGPLELDERPVVPAECRGALSLGRRFQDPLAELVTIDPKALALGPHLHEVNQGRLRRLLDETVQSCVAYVGIDPNHASVDLLARVPGFDRASATAFHLWRAEHGALRHKAALAAVPGVGTSVAEQAVGFLRLGDADDPRDTTQLHPEQYTLVEKMATQVGADVDALFREPGLRAQVRLGELETPDAPLPLLRYVLYQATAGHEDPRPRFATPIPPPPGLTLATLQPGLILEGRVVRAMPFGVFVDVGMGTDALVPTAHIGDHPGVDPATIAPVGAVVQARVLEVVPERRRLTLTMRRDRVFESRGGPRGGPRGGVSRFPSRDGEAPRGGGRHEGQGPRGRGGDRGRGRGDGEGRPAGRGGARGGGRPTSGGQGGGRKRGGPSRPGKFGPGGVSDIFDRRGRDFDRGAPRTIRLDPDQSEETTTPAEDLSPEELMKRKLEELKKKFEGR